ncbi:DUF2335 domain-containing protein [Mycolicibacterium smegmatis]|uniref:DUF2335 domain-containing protein n=1 Tax=Mycolicibacterium smegmatis TaxID=1772 RepID=UPI0039FCD155
MPPPKALREYEEICPGAADRVLRMAMGCSAGDSRTAKRGNRRRGQDVVLDAHADAVAIPGAIGVAAHTRPQIVGRALGQRPLLERPDDHRDDLVVGGGLEVLVGPGHHLAGVGDQPVVGVIFPAGLRPVGVDEPTTLFGVAQRPVLTQVAVSLGVVVERLRGVLVGERERVGFRVGAPEPVVGAQDQGQLLRARFADVAHVRGRLEPPHIRPPAARIEVDERQLARALLVDRGDDEAAQLAAVLRVAATHQQFDLNLGGALQRVDERHAILGGALLVDGVPRRDQTLEPVFLDHHALGCGELVGNRLAAEDRETVRPVVGPQRHQRVPTLEVVVGSVRRERPLWIVGHRCPAGAFWTSRCRVMSAPARSSVA